MISTAANPRIKSLAKLVKQSKYRLEQNSFGVEGLREIEAAVKAGLTIKSFFYCSEQLSAEEYMFLDEIRVRCAKAGTRVEPQAFSKLVVRKNGGLFVEFQTPVLHLNDLTLKRDPLILILDGIEKPGNIGAMLRTGDAVGVDAVLLCGDKIDLFNPHAIRSSLGGIFSIPIVADSSENILKFLKLRNVKTLGAIVQEETSVYHQESMTGPVAFAMGGEASGLSDFWRKNVDQPVKIPMAGKLDSLNVSVACSILLFEAVRQRSL